MFRAAAIALSAILCGPALAADLAPVQPSPTKGWEVKIQPYLWALSMDATIQPGPNVPPSDVSLRFNDILENLKFAGMMAASAHYGRFGVAADLQYASLRASGQTPGQQFSRARVSTKLFVGSLYGDYKAIDNARSELILSAGARAYNSDTELTLTANNLPQVSASGSDFWVDPMIGVRGTVSLTPKFFANGWAYVGGFGAGSDISADLFGGVGYNFTPSIAANVGYRYQRIDRDTNTFEFDATMYGPFAGLVFSF